jgi:hypothetical protein
MLATDDVAASTPLGTDAAHTQADPNVPGRLSGDQRRWNDRDQARL